MAFGCIADRGVAPDNLTGGYHEARPGGVSEKYGIISRSPLPDGQGGNGSEAGNASNALVERVIPSGGIALPVRWGDIGPLTVGSGALNITKFEALLERNGRPMTPEQKAILVNGSGDFVRVDRNNSYFILNLFWALGLANDNRIIRNLSASIGSAAVGNLASTGYWSLGERSGRELFSSRKIIELSESQQATVEEVARNAYRPCCDNPTSFPDCNHGMAALGLAEWMSYQNASEDDIYRAILAANSYWFPQAYVETAAYFEYQNISWEKVDAKEVLSAGYSSYTGYQSTKRKMEGFPPVAIPGGGCFT